MQLAFSFYLFGCGFDGYLIHPVKGPSPIILYCGQLILAWSYYEKWRCWRLHEILFYDCSYAILCNV